MSASNWIGGFVLVVLFGGILWFYNAEYDPTAPIKQETVPKAGGDSIRVSVAQVLAGYRKDAKRADRVLKDRIATVSGTIASIRTNWLGEPVVELRGDRAADGTVFFVLKKDQATPLEAIRPGDPVSLEGICVGKRPRYGIKFEGCILVSGVQATEGTQSAK